jgi:hypothetical protein
MSKPHITAEDHCVLIYYDRGFAAVYGSGRAYVFADTGTTMHRSAEGVWSWDDRRLVSGWLPEPVVDALMRWCATADGRAWVERARQ